MLTGGRERIGKRNVDRMNRVDWRAESCLQEENGLDCGILTEGTEWTGERKVDWGTDRTGVWNMTEGTEWAEG